MMGSDQYCLKWNNHWANLVRVFNSLLHSETFVDVTLACEGRHLKAHRLVLSACSPYFKELLVSHPDKHPIVILKDVRYSELQHLIQFIYNGEVSVEQHDLASLLCTARELQIKGLADNCISNSLPSSVTSKAVKASESSALKDSTNVSSILIPTKPNDEPTNLNVRSNNTSSTTPCSVGLPSPVHSFSCSPHSIHSLRSPHSSPRSPHSPAPLLPSAADSLGTIPSKDAKSPPTRHQETSSREGSPVSKRRKVSRTNAIESNENVTCLSNEVVKIKLPLQTETTRENVAGPSGIVQPATISLIKEEVLCIDEDSSEEKENLQPEVDMLKEPKDKPPDIPQKSVREVDSDGEESMNMQPPEVILEEDDSGVVTTNGTSSPPPTTSTSSNFTEVPKSSNSSLSPQISFLQQALAMGYTHPPLHFLQSPMMDQHQQPKTQGAHQNLPSSGLTQAKNILNFVDLLKVMGAAMPPSSQQGLLTTTGNSTSPSLQNSTGLTIVQNNSAGEQDRNPLTCHICARIMPSLQVLEEHVRIHEEEKPYKCEQCGQRYKYQSAFQRHQEQNHTAKLPGDKPYRCDVCGQCFKYHKSFTKHRANHDLLDSFMKTEPGEDGKGVIRALQESYLQRLLHPSFTHTDPILQTIKEEIKDPLECDGGLKEAKSPCLVSSSSFGGAYGSENGEIKEEEDDMDIDEIVPDVPGDGEEDAEENNGGRFFYCTQCKLTFRDSKAFDGHCRLSPGCSSETLKEVSVGGDISVTSVPSSVGSSPQGSPQPSQSVGQGGGVSQPPTSHSTSLIFSSPPAMLYTLVSGLPQSSCFTNASAMPTILNLSKLVNLSLPNFTNTVRPSDTLSVSFGNAAGGIPGSVNSILGGMEEERPFKCPYCQKGFKGRENLKLHIRTHTGEKPYNCGVCGKAFGGRSDMNRHLRIHTGEKPYPCKVCGKKFARADYLSKHITTHLGIPFAKPVHSLQQSLQNLENMQNLQNLENMQNLQQSVSNLQNLSVPSMQNLQSVPSLQSLQSFQNLQSLQSVPTLQTLQSVQNQQQTTENVSNKEEVPNFTK